MSFIDSVVANKIMKLLLCNNDIVQHGPFYDDGVIKLPILQWALMAQKSTFFMAPVYVPGRGPIRLPSFKVWCMETKMFGPLQ